MNIKIGDNVRYLNAVGGGVVTRIEGKIAYVDEDGFETPVMVSEIVVVGEAQTSKAWQEVRDRKDKEARDEKARSESKVSAAEKEAQVMSEKEKVLPSSIIETEEGDVLNLTLGFEADDLKAISRTGYSAYLVNDSNYWLSYVFATRAEDEQTWTCRSQGLLEPNFEGLLWKLEADDLTGFDRFSLKVIPFKKDKPYKMMATVDFERKVDATKFVKLHCFRPNPYFEVPVIAWEIVKDGKPVKEPDYEALLARDAAPKQADRRPVKKQQSKPAAHPGLTVVDLHIDSLLDSTSGMSPAEILNYQVDVFRREMDSRLKKPGERIVFIHGKGNGVLRAALMKELNHRYKGHEVRDASFAEYGFGATEVVIKNLR